MTCTFGSISIDFITTWGGNPSSLGENILEVVASSNRHGNYLEDTSEPDGDVCREDCTLKDASEMEWPTLPTAYNRSVCSFLSQHGSELEFPSSPSELLGQPRLQLSRGLAGDPKHI